MRTSLKIAILSVALMLLCAPVAHADADRGTSGTITVNGGAVVLSLGTGQATCAVTLSGTWTATVAPKIKTTAGGAFATVTWATPARVTSLSATANGDFLFPCAGAYSVEVVATAFTSGTVVVSLSASTGAPGAGVNSAIPQFVVGTIADGTSGAAATNNLGVLSAVANAVEPTRTEATEVLMSSDLQGTVRAGIVPFCNGTAVNVTTSVASATGTVADALYYWVCAEGAPVMAIWGATATLTTGFYMPEGACAILRSSGTNLSAITRAGGGFLHATSCTF